MASNFKIFIHRNDENVHFKLAGDFDESSAYELLRTFQICCREASRAFVHTNNIKQIYPSGREILQANIDVVNRRHITIIFTGDKSDQLAPEGMRE